MVFHTSPSVLKFASELEHYSINVSAENDLSIEYLPILAAGKVRLLELRQEWSELGALHQLRDELCVLWSLYSYVWQFPELIRDNLANSAEHQLVPEVHPRATTLVQKDELLEPWRKMSDAAPQVMPSLAIDQYWSILSSYQKRLEDLQTDERVSELGAIYSLIDELSAHVALMKRRARLKQYKFFDKRR